MDDPSRYADSIRTAYQTYLQRRQIRVRGKIKGNQQLLRRPTEDQSGKTPTQVDAQKNIPAMIQLIEEEIGSVSPRIRAMS